MTSAPPVAPAAKPALSTVGNAAPTTAKQSTVSPSSSAPAKVLSPPPFKLGMTTGVGRYLKLLAYGKAGMGKTELLTSSADVPDMQDILFIDAEKGEMTVEGNPRIANWDSILQNRVHVTTFKQIAEVHGWLQQHCRVRDEPISERTTNILRVNEARLRGCAIEDIVEPRRFKTVIIDSLTEINAYSNYELLGIDQTKVLSGEADEVDVAGWDEFRKNNQRIQMLLRAFRDLPMHILVSCGAQYKQDEMKKMHWEPAITGQLASQIQGFFDIVGYMVVGKQGEKTEHRMYVQPTGSFAAKNRRSVFKGEFFINANMTMVMKETGLMK
jgi:hypothetical protein